MDLKKRVKAIKKYYDNNLWVTIAIIILVIIFTALIEHYLGRILICKCNYVMLWYNNANGSGNSQHIFDWYSLSHVVHGILFFALLWLFARKLPVKTRLILAVVIECAWEIFENSPFLIDRYRTATFALDYYGDSIINSIFDVFSMMIGFLLAYRLKKWQSIVLIIILEIFVFFMIRDNLTLNIINLTYPIESIKNFQAAAPVLPDLNTTIFHKIFLTLIS